VTAVRRVAREGSCLTAFPAQSLADERQGDRSLSSVIMGMRHGGIGGARGGAMRWRGDVDEGTRIEREADIP